MRKNILLIIIILAGIRFGAAQTFIQAGFRFNLLEVSFGDEFVKGGKGIDFQIGKFVDDRKMRAFYLSYRFGRKHNTNEYTGFYDPITGQNLRFNRTFSSTVFSIGYERKHTFANTEFDDVWQYYNIFNYSVGFVNVKETTVPLPSSNYSGNYAGSTVTLDFAYGLGMARKINVKTYVYAEVRMFMPMITLNFYSGGGFHSNFGVRHFIR